MANRPADIIDEATEVAQRMIDEQLQLHAQKQARLPTISRTSCIDCDEPIPEMRQLAVKGCQRCIECQQLVENTRR